MGSFEEVECSATSNVFTADLLARLDEIWKDNPNTFVLLVRQGKHVGTCFSPNHYDQLMYVFAKQ